MKKILLILLILLSVSIGYSADLQTLDIDQLDGVAGSVFVCDSDNKCVLTSTLDNATGDESAFTLNYTTNKATSGGDTGLLINQTDTLSPGISYLIDAQVGGVSKFSVDNGGGVRSLSSYTLSTHDGSLTSANNDQTLGIQTRSLTTSKHSVKMTQGSYSGAGVTQVAVSILPTINQTTTSSMTDLLINRTQTAVGSGAQLLFDAQVDSVSKFKVSNGGLVTNVVQAVTCTDGVGKSALTITPTSSYVEITNADVDGCDITMGETGMLPGMSVTLCVVSNAGTTVDFADTAGITELAGAFTANIDDCLVLRYGNTTTWREVSRSSN